MTEKTKDTKKVILQEDPLLTQRPHFDFDVLRREGLEHIGELSGKIWTDHNTHDPGVTILEELCYALIDLGYRTTLPIEDLLAEPKADSKEKTEKGQHHNKNFFTPYEILSCNPTTILDYRKLLLDIEGVRNVWLEPIEVASSPSLYLQKLHTNDKDVYYNLQCQTEEVTHSEGQLNSIDLNGLYRILIQKEGDKDDKQLVKDVLKTLVAHRNLCEDFDTVSVLCPLDVGICADVQIEEMADPAGVYEAVIRAVRSYISPELRYYTLKELLDKGKPIEDIFAGRPMPVSPKTSRSAGFVDTEELEAIPFRQELYGSDLYAAVLNVEGVVAIQNLSFQTSEKHIVGERIQRVCIPLGWVAEFSLDQSCVQLQSTQGRVSLNKEHIHSRLQQGGKPSRGIEHLDVAVPKGRYRADLEDYYSIQHDFPLVYGIGEGGLPNEATLLRKVQAMQLKGYLLFYDQLLANYLAQMANIRHLFSLQPESQRADSAKHTYFSQDVENVPDRKKLFPQHAGKNLTERSILAVPVANDASFGQKLKEIKASSLNALLITDSCVAVEGEISHLGAVDPVQRDGSIRQSIRDFQQSRYDLEFLRDCNGYLFILRFRQACEWLWVSYHRYKTQDEAREAAHLATFLASQPEYYDRKKQQLDQNGIRLVYQFNLIHKPEAYADYLQFLVENEDLYLQRREAFLDHLLARFATHFTDYTLLRFNDEAPGKVERQQTIEDKSQFLSQIDDLGRNRGRAYNYLEPSWGTDNVSGFEKRVSLLAGMHAYQRRHLCKFEVVKCFRIEMDGPDNELLFDSIETYHLREELKEARTRLLKKLGDPGTYSELQKRYRGFDPELAHRIFSRKATDENIQVSKHVYALTLNNCDGNILNESITQDYKNKPSAWQEINKFITESNIACKVELVEADVKNRLYIDKKQMQCRVEPIISYKWHRFDSQGKRIASAAESYSDHASAIKHFAKNGDHANFIVSKSDVVLWNFKLGKKLPSLESIHAFDNELEAQRAWLRSRSEGKIRECYKQDSDADKPGTRITLTTEGGFELATTFIAEDAPVKPDEYIKLCLAEFGKDTASPDFTVLSSAFGWRLPHQEGDAPDGDDSMMESVLLFRNIPDALLGLSAALIAAKNAKHYFEAGTEDNPDYRILLRSAAGPFIASTASYANANERTQSLKNVRERMKQVRPPMKVLQQPKRFRWELCRTTDEQVILDSGQDKLFRYEKDAKKDFASHIHRIYKDQSSSPLAQKIYRIELKEIEDKFRFVYFINDLANKQPPQLRSVDEFDKKEAKRQYAKFATALPDMKLNIKNGTPHISGSDAGTALLKNDTKDNRKRTKHFLNYMRRQHGNSVVEEATPKWIYRLLDRDHPIAKSQQSYKTCDEAKTAKKLLCGYKTCAPLPNYEPCPTGEVVRVICPELNPDKYHYALFLFPNVEDECEVESATLISYMGYDSEDAARKAGEENWLKLIELAADPKNYGDNKKIAEKEIYAKSTGSACDESGRHLAVKPGTVETDHVVCLAKCYPVRISYKKDEKGKLTNEGIGFHFQAYDGKTDSTVWRSTLDYSDVEQAREAYKLFLTILGNADSCRIVCEEGCYRIHLIEILAESGEFDTEDNAWDKVMQATKDDCGEHCFTKGVRLFAQSATSEAAYIPVCDRDCYRFAVVASGYKLARHTCDYASRSERDAAIDKFHAWGRSLNSEQSRSKRKHKNFDLAEDHVENPVYQQDKQYRFRLYSPENRALLDEKLSLCCHETNHSEQPSTLPYCGRIHVYESVENYSCRAEAEKAYLRFITLLTEKDNYQRTEETGLGTFSFSIIDREKVLASHPHSHPDRTSAMKAEERTRACVKDEGMHLVEHILLRPVRDEDCNCLLPVCPDKDCILEWQECLDPEASCIEQYDPSFCYIPGADPYSFWATVVLPSWTERFRNSEKRYAFKQMLHREAPAMVGLNIMWLGPQDMCKFEAAYKQWLRSKQCPSALCDDDTNPLCDMVNSIEELRNEPPCPVPDSAESDCDCLTVESQDQDDCCIEDVENLFWLDCKPESKPADDAVIRKALNERKKVFNKSLDKIDVDAIRKTKSYNQAKDFLTVPPTLKTFKQLADEIQNDIKQKKPKEEAALLIAFSNAFWFLLDNLLHKHPTEVTQEAIEMFPPLLQTMKQKGLLIEKLAIGWQGEALGRLFGCRTSEVVREYLMLIRGC